MLITTCPQCRAKFRVTEQHLSAADGLVVCSRCRSIFQAKDALQEIPEAKPKTVEPPAEKVSATLFGNSIRSGRDKNTTAADTAFTPPSASPDETDTPADHLDNPEPDTAATRDAPSQSSWLSRLFGGGKKPTPSSATDEEETPREDPATDTVASAQPDLDDHPAAAGFTAPPAEEPPPAEDETSAASLQGPPADEPAAEPEHDSKSEEFSAVPEAEQETVAALEYQSAQQTFLPGARNEAPPPYDPRFDPRLYAPVATREEMNWTMASIVALIVLIIQLFYIILQK